MSQHKDPLQATLWFFGIIVVAVIFVMIVHHYTGVPR